MYNVPVPEKYSNIRPSEVDYIKKKIYIKMSVNDSAV